MTRMLFVLITVTLVLTGSAAFANTTMGRGVIVSVEAEGKNGGRAILVRNEFSTPRDQEDALVRWAVAKDAVITLDGVKADFAAFAPGRLVFLCADCQIFKVFTKTHLFATATAADPATAWWTIRLPATLMQPGAKAGGALILHLELRAGAVRQAAALTPAWGPGYGSSAAWHPVDAKGLKFAEGRLTGTCTVTLEDRGAAFAGGGTSEKHELAFALAADGSGTVSCDGKALAGATVECRTLPVIPEDWYCFLRAPDPVVDKGWPLTLRLEIRRQKGAIAQSAFRHGIGKPGPGPAATTLEAAITEGRMNIRAADAKVAYEMTGFILGDRVFGAYTAKAGERTWQGRFSAYLRQAEALSVGWDEPTAKKEAAALKAGTP